MNENKIIDESKQGESLLMDGPQQPNGKKLFLESYGCAMNFSDSEIIASILTGIGFQTTNKLEEANVVFLNTCAIRDNAENRVRQRLQDLKKSKNAVDIR